MFGEIRLCFWRLDVITLPGTVAMLVKHVRDPVLAIIWARFVVVSRVAMCADIIGYWVPTVVLLSRS